MGIDDDIPQLQMNNTPNYSAPTNEDGMDIGVSSDSNQNDQVGFFNKFARFLCQQLVKELPDRFLGAGSSDDEEENRWIGYLRLT